MRKLAVFVSLLALFNSGCLVYEKEEVKVKLTPGGAEIWVTQIGWKSSNEEEEKILKDFDELPLRLVELTEHVPDLFE